MSYRVTGVVLAAQDKVPFLFVGLAGCVILAVLVWHRIDAVNTVNSPPIYITKTPPTKLLSLPCFDTP